MLIEIVSTDMIKPSSSTPDHLRLHNLSLVDQLFPPLYTTLLLYYVHDNTTPQRTTILRRLEKSLSDILTLYYPFSGRISVNKACVECTNVGVPFKEAKVINSSSSLMEFLLEKRDPNILKQFLPVKGSEFEEAGIVPLQIQATFFQCGGMVLGICASHKIMDGAALFAFIRSWASYSSTNNLEHEEDVKTKPDDPQLTLLSSLVPSSDFLHSITTGQQAMKRDYNDVITKIFVFKAATIDVLKFVTRSVTRFQAVSALIWKCAIKATKSNKTVKKSSSIMLVAVNMRTRLDPKLPENSIGNFIGNFNVQKDYDEENIDNINLGELVIKMKNGLMGFCDDYIKKLQLCEEGMGSVILESAMESRDIVMREDIDLFHNSSWCGFKLYEVDFGWGKPTWVSTTSSPHDNLFVLIDDEDGYGIEVWVTLKKQDMAVFEQDGELLSFASVFPNEQCYTYFPPSHK